MLIQTFNTGAATNSLDEDQWVFSQDSVVLSYAFYADHGMMAFTVYNLRSTPIYIDWKRSSLVVNNEKINYWNDETRTSGLSVTASRTLAYNFWEPDWYWIRSGWEAATIGVTASASVSQRSERIAFVPPNSYTDQAKAPLYPGSVISFGTKALTVSEPCTYKPSKKCGTTVQTFTQNDSPLRFRNYLAITLDEAGEQVTFLDHAFWVSSVQEMKLSHFRGKVVDRDEDQKPIYARPFRTRKSFYVKPE